MHTDLELCVCAIMKAENNFWHAESCSCVCDGLSLIVDPINSIYVMVVLKKRGNYVDYKAF